MIQTFIRIPYYLLVALLFSSSYLLHGQQNNLPQMQQNLQEVDTKNFAIINSTDERSLDTHGTPFLLDTVWSSGVVVSVDGQVFEPEALKYNAHTQELFYLNPRSNSISIFNTYRIKSFTLNTREGPRQFIRLDSLSSDSEYLDTFFEPLVIGEVSLLKHYGKRLKKGDRSDAYAVGERYDEYLDEVDYFLWLPEQQIMEVPTGRKKFGRLFGNLSDKVNHYLKNNSLSLRNEQDLKNVVVYINQNS